MTERRVRLPEIVIEEEETIPEPYYMPTESPSRDQYVETHHAQPTTRSQQTTCEFCGLYLKILIAVNVDMASGIHDHRAGEKPVGEPSHASPHASSRRECPIIPGTYALLPDGSITPLYGHNVAAVAEASRQMGKDIFGTI
ncbi:MAG: hypothetical protein GPJ52_15490 [Candidatus Heimdallarchaeota archaeon]|nr:hypothetical protein [Candidatus Heimdallarchaeota archaeon]